MDKVILLSKHITNIKVISKAKGRWEKGKYIADEEKEKIINYKKIWINIFLIMQFIGFFML